MNLGKANGWVVAFLCAGLFACASEGSSARKEPAGEGRVHFRVHDMTEADLDEVHIELVPDPLFGGVARTLVLPREATGWSRTVPNIEVGRYQARAFAYATDVVDPIFHSDLSSAFDVAPGTNPVVEIFLYQDAVDDALALPRFTQIVFDREPLRLGDVGIEIKGDGGEGALTLSVSGAGAGTFTITDAGAKPGPATMDWAAPLAEEATFTLTLTDEALNQVSHVLTVPLGQNYGDVPFNIHFNHAPEAKVVSVVTHDSTGVTVAIDATYTDLDNHGVTATWDFSDCTGPGGFTLSGDATTSPYVTTDASSSFTLSANDPNQSCSLTISVVDDDTSPASRGQTLLIETQEVGVLVCLPTFVDPKGCGTPEVCVDVDSDPDHCGDCDIACGVDEACEGGSCELVCPAGWGNCDGDKGNGCETNLMLDDVNNCGACNTVCDFCDAGQCIRLEQVSVGWGFGCAIEDGSVHCWGTNTRGQLGNGNTSSSLHPVAVQGLGASKITQISAGHEHACAVSEDGEAWCWGNNNAGQLGVSSPSSSSTPIQILAGNTVHAIATGLTHSCAIVGAARELYCWGSDNGLLDTKTPAKHGALSNLVQVDLSWYGTCVVDQNGKAYCGGSFPAGNGNTPGDLTGRGASGAVKIVTAPNHACYLDGDGEVFCSGSGSAGELGDGNSTNSTNFVQVTGLSDVQDISTGYNAESTCALTTQGEVWCWGKNDYGQLGRGNTTPSPVPVQVLGLPASSGLSFGGRGTVCAIPAAGGGMSCWGENRTNVLGNGVAGNQSSPVAFEWLP